MWQETLVDGKNTFRLDSFCQAVEYTVVKIARLVIQARHNGVWGMHHTAHNKSAGRAAGKMKCWPFLHTQMPDQASLGEEIGGELDGATETGPDHGGAYTSVKARYAFTPVDLGEAVQRIPVLVLSANGQEGRVTLQSGFNQEKGAPGSRADDAGAGPTEHVDAQALCFLIGENQARYGGAHGLIETQAAAVEEDLVYVGAAETAIDAAETFIPNYDGDAVEGAAVMVRLVPLFLELSLQLHAGRPAHQPSSTTSLRSASSAAVCLAGSCRPSGRQGETKFALLTGS